MLAKADINVRMFMLKLVETKGELEVVPENAENAVTLAADHISHW
jgi:hypothetical protein